MRHVLAGVMLALSACAGDRPFHTIATYQAPRSHCSIRVEARGEVRSGADLAERADGLLTVQASAPPPGMDAHPATISVSLRGGRTYLGETPIDDVGAARTSAVSTMMSEAGCSPDPGETGEAVEAAEGVLLGPKATRMAGQTALLKVISTTFD